MQERITITLETYQETLIASPVRDHFLYNGRWYRLGEIETGEMIGEASPQTPVILCACTAEEVHMLYASPQGELARLMERTAFLRTTSGPYPGEEEWRGHVYPIVECSYSLYVGNGEWKPAQPVRYENVTRQQALHRLADALRAGDPHVNPHRQRYTDLQTRGIE